MTEVGGVGMFTRRWAVVQDLRPFGFRVEKRYRWKRHADWVAGGSRYLAVRPTAWVEQENTRLLDPDEFEADLLLRAPGEATP